MQHIGDSVSACSGPLVLGLGVLINLACLYCVKVLAVPSSDVHAMVCRMCGSQLKCEVQVECVASSLRSSVHPHIITCVLVLELGLVVNVVWAVAAVGCVEGAAVVDCKLLQFHAGGKQLLHACCELLAASSTNSKVLQALKALTMLLSPLVPHHYAHRLVDVASCQLRGESVVGALSSSGLVKCSRLCAYLCMDLA